jgi:hypothetical protein
LFNGHSLTFSRTATITKYRFNYSGLLKNLPRWMLVLQIIRGDKVWHLVCGKWHKATLTIWKNTALRNFVQRLFLLRLGAHKFPMQLGINAVLMQQAFNRTAFAKYQCEA